jgi:hypothetical protein
LTQRDIVLDIFWNQSAVLRWHGAEITGGKDRVGGQIGKMLIFDDVAHLIAGNVGLEVGLDGRDSGGLLGLGVSDELGELLFQKLVLGLEARDKAEDFLQDLPKGQASVYGGGFAQLVEGVVLRGSRSQ